MFIKVTTHLFFEVADKDEGQDTCNTLSLGLDDNSLSSYPGPGKFILSEVDTFAEATPEEIKHHELEPPE